MKAISFALLVALTAAFAGVGHALATTEADPVCATAASLVSADFKLSQAATAIKNKQLTVAVVGSASSTLPDAKKAYPARLEAMLGGKLPGVAVRVVAHVKARESASESLPELRKLMAVEKPSIVIWQ